jgi:glyoxylase-like metal-dependent hydrolase (beta-lactamase superfamily II)
VGICKYKKLQTKMITKIKNNVWKISFNQFGSLVYLIKLKNKNILIDTSSPDNIPELESDLKNLGLSPQDISTIILTHNHWDHTGGIILFLDAEFYASKLDFGENLKEIHKLNIPEFKIIDTPGHSKGGICILYKDILFSGDTIFHRGTIGRTDLPGSDENEMKKSLEKLKKIKYKILCPGHGSN